MFNRCQKCGRKLTDPESVIRGYGPECWESIVGNYRDMLTAKIQEDQALEAQIPGQMDFSEFPDIIPEND